MGKKTALNLTLIPDQIRKNCSRTFEDLLYLAHNIKKKKLWLGTVFANFAWYGRTEDLVPIMKLAVELFTDLHRNLVGSSAERAGGSLSAVVVGAGSTAIGFLIPWPPLMISRGASAGIPN